MMPSFPAIRVPTPGETPRGRFAREIAKMNIAIAPSAAANSGIDSRMVVLSRRSEKDCASMLRLLTGPSPRELDYHESVEHEAHRK